MQRFSLEVALVALIWLSLGSALSQPVTAAVCQITNITYDSPNNANPGEQFTVSATLSGTCAPSDSWYYSARVDITDSSNRVIASNTGALSYAANNGQPFTVTVPNQLTAPSSVGPWRFQYVVYVFVSSGGGNTADYETTQPETIQIGQVTITQTMYSTVALTTTQTSNSTVTVAITQQAGLPLSSEQLYPVLAVVFGVLFVIVLTLLVRQRRFKN